MNLFLPDTCGPDQLTCKNGQCGGENRSLCNGQKGGCADDSDEDENICGKSHMFLRMAERGDFYICGTKIFYPMISCWKSKISNVFSI